MSPHRFPLLRSGSVATRKSASISRPTTPSKSRSITPIRVRITKWSILFFFHQFVVSWFLFCVFFSTLQNQEDQLRFGLDSRKKTRKKQSSSSNQVRANDCLRLCLVDAKPRKTTLSTLSWTNTEGVLFVEPVNLTGKLSISLFLFN